MAKGKQDTTQQPESQPTQPTQSTQPTQMTSPPPAPAVETKTKTSPPATPICAGALEVRIFDYATTGETGRYQDQRGHPGVEVTVAGARPATQSTNEQGLAVWRNLAPGTQTIAIESPPNWRIGEVYTAVGQEEFAACKVNNGAIEVMIEESTTTHVLVGLQPEAAKLTVAAVRLTHDEAGHPVRLPVGAAQVDLYQGSQRIDCRVFDDKGLVHLDLDRYGVFELRPQPIEVEGCLFDPTSEEVQVTLAPGQAGHVVVEYGARLGDIQIETLLVDDAGAAQPRLLPGARYGLWRGDNITGPPLQTRRAGLTRLAFTGLEPGLYTVGVLEPPQQANQSLEASEPTSGRRTVSVLCGQAAIARFVYRACRARLQGRVVDRSCGDGLAGAPVLLRSADDLRILHETVTNEMGAYAFDGLAPGAYIVTLAAEQFTLAGGQEWELSPQNTAERRVTITGHEQAWAADFFVQRAVHRVRGAITTLNGEPLAFAVVEIQDADGRLIDRVSADDAGQYEWNAERAGLYYLVLPQAPGGGPLRRVPAVINSEAIVNLTSDGGGGGGGRRPAPPSDVTTFPILTEEVDAAAIPTGRGGSARGAAGPVVERALRHALSWRPRKGDPKGFLTALNQSITAKEKEGRTVWQWTPRSYAVQVEAGAITGAQASIYTRAKNALDQALPQLKHLSTLGTDTDTEQQEALLAIIESEFTELVSEFGHEGGPRVQRVDMLFQLLLGKANSLDTLGGHLGELQEELGLEPDNVNTVDEEQNLTRFGVSVDYLIDLRRSWDAQRNFFDRSGQGVFLGTQLVLIGRALTVIAESVQEVYYTMNSVFMGAAERQATQLHLSGGPLLVSELLGWAEHVAAEEGHRLIRDGGKAGVIALRTTAQTLAALVQEAQTTAYGGRQQPDDLPEGYATPRVQRALAELQHHLAELATLAGQLAPSANPRAGRLARPLAAALA